jgi:hypothetical protein
MKLKLFISLILSFIFLAENMSFSKPAEPQVKGGYKTCTVTEYRYTAGKPNKKGEIQYKLIFDDKGNQIEIVSYDENKKTYKNKVSNKYNASGLLSETIYFDIEGKASVKFTYSYDERMNLITDITYDKDDKKTAKGSYFYDENDFLVKEVHEFYTDNDVATGVTYFKNDKFGNKLEESANHSSEISVEVSAEVDLGNNTSKSEVLQEQSPAELDKVTYEYEYNDKNQIIKDIRNGIGGTKLIHGYSYDKFGNILERISYDENNKPAVKLVYEYGK